MGMDFKKLNGTDYACALKAALELRRSGKCPPAVDEQLGHMFYNIANWAIQERRMKGSLMAKHYEDPDFLPSVTLRVVQYADKVDLGRAPKEIIIYLKRVGNTAINDILDYQNASKRQRVEFNPSEIPLTLTADFYGEAEGRTKAAIMTHDFDIEQ